MRISPIIAVASFFASASAVSAATITPVAGTASSQFPGYAANAAFDTGPNAANTDWAALSEGARSYIDLALGGNFLLGGATVVDRVTSGGPNGTYFGGTGDYTTQFSIQAISGLGGTLLGTAQNFSFARPTGTVSYSDFVHNISFAMPLNASFVRYTVVAAANGSNPGLANISFQTTAVPEPATWGMMVLGFGAVGGVLRSRRTAGKLCAA